MKRTRFQSKILRQNKQYGAKKFQKEFLQKGWSLGELKKLVRKIDTTGTAARRPGSDVEALVLSQDDNPQTHRTQRQIARELGISQPSVNNIVKLDLRLKCLKKRKASRKKKKKERTSLTHQSSNGVGVSVRVLQWMADSLNINYEWNIIRTI